MQTNFSKYLLVTICSITLIYMITLAWASLLTVRPAKTIGQWYDSNESYDNELASRMENRLKRSIDLNSKNPKSHLLLADLYFVRAIDGNALTPSTFKDAEKYYLQSTSLQPTWDVSWAKLAVYYHKTNINNIQDQKLMNTLLVAMKLGKYELDSQQYLLPVIFKNWNLISSNLEGNELKEALIRHALVYYSNARLVLNLAKQNSLIQEIKPLVKAQWQLKQLRSFEKEQEKEMSLNE